MAYRAAIVDDSATDAEFLQRILNIYISHRLSSCKFCDEIAVFHEGAVIQQGAHADLLADVNGKYYELWHAQAQYYNEKTA